MRTDRTAGESIRRMLVLLLAAGRLGGCAAAHGDDNAAIYGAWADQRSRVEVTADGTVARILGTRQGRSGAHEGFLLHLRGAGGHGLSVRVETNVDITGAIPLEPGESVEVRGEYIYDPRGGIIHYTHHDPAGRHESGYVEAGGDLYR